MSYKGPLIDASFLLHNLLSSCVFINKNIYIILIHIPKPNVGQVIYFSTMEEIYTWLPQTFFTQVSLLCICVLEQAGKGKRRRGEDSGVMNENHQVAIKRRRRSQDHGQDCPWCTRGGLEEGKARGAGLPSLPTQRPGVWGRDWTGLDHTRPLWSHHPLPTPPLCVLYPAWQTEGVSGEGSKPNSNPSFSL